MRKNLIAEQFDNTKTTDQSLMLASFGIFASGEKIVFEESGKKIELLYPVKTWSSEKEKNSHRWKFCGCSLKINSTDFKWAALCISGPRLFKQIIPKGWSQYGKIGSLFDKASIYVPDVNSPSSHFLSERTFSLREKEIVENCRKWIESELCVYFSASYAFLFSGGVLEILFWNPDEYLQPDDIAEYCAEAVKNINNIKL